MCRKNKTNKNGLVPTLTVTILLSHANQLFFLTQIKNKPAQQQDVTNRKVMEEGCQGKALILQGQSAPGFCKRGQQKDSGRAP